MEKMVSYAQNHEDVLLRRLFPGRADGFYVDVGAGHPAHDSVTKYFYDLGWRGINVEPNPGACELLRADRPRDLTLNLGVSDRDGTLTFYETPGTACWSTSPDFLVGTFGADRSSIVGREVAVTTLASVCARHADRPIDFLKIDCEGHDTQVVAGADLARWRPRAVVVEGYTEAWWAPHFDPAGYVHAAFDGVNHYFLRDEDRDLLPRLAAPVNVTDNYTTHECERLLHQLWSARAERDAAAAELESLRARLDGLGPVALGLARRLQRLARRLPAPAAIRRAARRVA